MSKLAYFAEFFFFPPLAICFAVLALYSANPPRLDVWTAVFLAGLLSWTLIEYLLHRFVFHHVPYISDMHLRHHHSPNELIGTPAWISALAGLIGVALPFCLLFGLNLAIAATGGIAAGYLWYVLVHYASHHWRPRPGSYLYRARQRHARHHHLSTESNFGVTTGVWDYVFGTALERRPRPSEDDAAVGSDVH